jgi:hypothetical protein
MTEPNWFAKTTPPRTFRVHLLTSETFFCSRTCATETRPAHPRSILQDCRVWFIEAPPSSPHPVATSIHHRSACRCPAWLFFFLQLLSPHSPRPCRVAGPSATTLAKVPPCATSLPFVRVGPESPHLTSIRACPNRARSWSALLLLTRLDPPCSLRAVCLRLGSHSCARTLTPPVSRTPSRCRTALCNHFCLPYVCSYFQRALLTLAPATLTRICWSRACSSACAPPCTTSTASCLRLRSLGPPLPHARLPRALARAHSVPAACPSACFCASRTLALRIHTPASL